MKWTGVPFNSSYAPGAKKFDFDINQVSINPSRAKAVDFSTPYYTTPQGVLVPGDSPYATATSVADLKDATHRRPGGHHQPRRGQPGDHALQRAARLQRLQRRRARPQERSQVNAIVTDLPTTIYLRDAEVEGSSKLVGQFAAPGGDDWGAGAGEGLGPDACVSKAVTELKDSGELAAITEQWIGAEAPVLALK